MIVSAAIPIWLELMAKLNSGIDPTVIIVGVGRNPAYWLVAVGASGGNVGNGGGVEVCAKVGPTIMNSRAISAVVISRRIIDSRMVFRTVSTLL